MCAVLTDTEHGVGTSFVATQPSPTELGHLDGDVIPFLLHEVDGFGNVLVHDSGSSGVYGSRQGTVRLLAIMSRRECAYR